MEDIEYYTSEAVAESLVRLTLNDLLPETASLYVEASARKDVFAGPLTELRLPVVSYEGFEPSEIDGLTVAIGDLPAGLSGADAINCFNEIAETVDVVALIVPLVFKKISFQNRLDKRFHLHAEHKVPKYAFVTNDMPYDIPSVFQIWKKQSTLRAMKIGHLGKYLKLTTPDNADFALSRVTGKVLRGLKHVPADTYFFKEVVSGVKDYLKEEGFSKVNVDGRPITQLEIFEYLHEKFTKN